MQEKNYKKFYFLDSKTHKLNEILAKIEIENFTGVIFRKNHNFDDNFIQKILKTCKEKKMLVFSHYSNNISCHVVHAGGESHAPKTAGRVCSFVWHKNNDFKAIQRIKPQYVFISPVFQTKTHPKTKPLGILMAFQVAKNVKKIR